ncbi:hypothetical protein N7516_007445 [Penicillium verrucosum]|uniref:uncharacterized protein n=1 Tax=Penicillium verrucosum TaxID=60171 RepID=UPI002545B6D1|nr:uncharacterized protein N7516_007445 [Penicillium verrucosum]KAJ5932956.1 hypothetical protein N7516_007445 [Penicillium verrucosum]
MRNDTVTRELSQSRQIYESTGHDNVTINHAAESLPIRSVTGETFYAEGYGDVVIDLAFYDYATDEQDTKERIRIEGIVLRKVW